MQHNVKIAIKLFPILIFTNIAFGQVVVTSVDSANALAFNNSRKLAVNADDVVSLVFHDKGEIFYTESNDKGFTWLSPINISLNSGISEFPALAIDSSGRKHIVWQDNTLPDNPSQFDDKIRIYYKNFVELSEVPQRYPIPIGESVGNSLYPSLTIDSDGKLYSAWAAFMGLNVGWEINYSEGTLIGNGLLGLYDWTLPEIPGTPLGIGSSFFPVIEANSHTVFVAWLEEDPFLQLVNLIRFRNTAGWSEHYSLSDEAIGPYSNSIAGIPSMVVDGDSTAHTVFQESLDFGNNSFNDIFYLDYNIGDTLTYETGENISRSEEPSSNAVIILDIHNNLHAAWEQKVENKIDIFISSRDSTGWSMPENISINQTDSFTPQIALVENDSLMVVWLEGDNRPYRLMAKKVRALITSINDPSESSKLEFQLFKNYPNPFNANTSISFYVPRPTSVELSVWNAKGQLVKTLFQGGDRNGYHTVSWDGTNNQGVPVSSGIYIITLKAKTVLKSIRAVLIK